MKQLKTIIDTLERKTTLYLDEAQQSESDIKFDFNFNNAMGIISAILSIGCIELEEGNSEEADYIGRVYEKLNQRQDKIYEEHYK